MHCGGTAVITQCNPNPEYASIGTQVVSDPQLARQALAAGFSCQPASTGDDILSYWELHLTAPEVIGILAGVYALFHAMSYIALMLLYRQKR